MKDIKTKEDLERLSSDELKEAYADLYKDAKDEWFPVMYVTEECQHCKGEAHIFENHKKNYLQIRCFNESCSYNGKIIDQFLKQDDYYRMAVSCSL